jgi:hypothetical protein
MTEGHVITSYSFGVTYESIGSVREELARHAFIPSTGMNEGDVE